MTQHLMLVLSNAKPDQDEEFNTWYKDVHVLDTINKLDGFARRSFSCSPIFQRPRSFPIGT